MLIDCRFQLQMGQFHIEPSFQSDASVIGYSVHRVQVKHQFYMPLQG